MKIRPFQTGDERALHAVFESAVRGLAGRDYTPEQIEAWVSANMDEARWSARMRANRPFVVEASGHLVAFADLQDSGCIDQFFVDASHAGRGVGALLMRHLKAEASARRIGEVYAHVSRTAQAFFARSGFSIVEQRMPVVGGVAIPNALMRKRMAAGEGQAGCAGDWSPDTRRGD